jgi:hypothetical protein
MFPQPEIGTLFGQGHSQQLREIILGLMKPGEHVVSAIRGTSGMRNAWLLLTSSDLLFVMEFHSGGGDIQGWHQLNQVTGADWQPAWTGWRLGVNTTSGRIELGGLDQTQLHAFANDLQMSINPPPPPIHPDIEAAIARADQAYRRLFAVGAVPMDMQKSSGSSVIAGDLILILANVAIHTKVEHWAFFQQITALASLQGHNWEEGIGRYLEDVGDRAGDFDLQALATIRLGKEAAKAGAEQEAKELLAAIQDVLIVVSRDFFSVDMPTANVLYPEELFRRLQSAIRGSESDSLDRHLARLQDLVGLSEVKAEVASMVNLMAVQQARVSQGLKASEPVMHLVFAGNPGTGKTVVARLLAQLYRSIGVLPEGHLVETSRADLVAAYVGQTAIKTTEVFQSARGGVLFIDEAYSLSRGTQSGDSYGQEAIDTLVKLMEDHRSDTMVIVAGYPNEMAEFISSNPGLSSRFKRAVFFPDYSTDELTTILGVFAAEGDYVLSDEAIKRFNHEIEALQQAGSLEGNARLVRKLFEHAVSRQASRLMALGRESFKEEMQTLLGEDFAIR